MNEEKALKLIKAFQPSGRLDRKLFQGALFYNAKFQGSNVYHHGHKEESCEFAEK